MTKVDELRELVEAASRLVGELAGMELGIGDADEVRQLADVLGDYAAMLDEVAQPADGVVDEVRRVAADLGDYVVASVVWSDGVVYEWAAGDVLIGRQAGTVEDAERVAASHGVPLEVL